MLGTTGIHRGQSRGIWEYLGIQLTKGNWMQLDRNALGTESRDELLACK